MAKRNRKRNIDVKAAAANDDTPVMVVEQVEQPQANEIVPAIVITKKPATPQAQATATGAGYAKLAGRPSKQAVTAVFGTTGYALSWVQRAVNRMNLFSPGLLIATPGALAAADAHCLMLVQWEYQTSSNSAYA